MDGEVLTKAFEEGSEPARRPVRKVRLRRVRRRLARKARTLRTASSSMLVPF